MTSRGALVLSMDFELHWGVRDHTPVARYRENLLGVREAIPAMLQLFRERQLACTWATVGMLMAESKEELLEAAPSRKPSYSVRRMSPYVALDEVGPDELSDPFHFAPSLVREILATPRQEIGTHTFSHYYALEPGQKAEEFEADLLAARRLAEKFGVSLKSIVFPRNQFVPAYLDVLRRVGVRAYRSNGPHWAYSARGDETPARRAFRLADAYLPLSGGLAFDWPAPDRGLVDVRASAFLRPWSARLRRGDSLRLHRIVRDMTVAAERGRVFHLWWHPHNFGRNLRENLRFLESILDAYERLRWRHGMASLTMGDVADRVLGPPSSTASPSAVP